MSIIERNFRISSDHHDQVCCVGKGTGGVSPPIDGGLGGNEAKYFAILSTNQAFYTRSSLASTLVILHQKYSTLH